MKKDNRYKTSHLPEAQLEPGSRGRVLRNRLGIVRKREMDTAETRALKLATDKFVKIYRKNHHFNEADIKNMHTLWLSDIYEWAGTYRNVNLSKDDFFFATARQIPSLMKQFEKDLLRKHTPCNFKTHDRIVRAIAETHTEIVLIHPFREGNGRLARLLATLMASQAGLPFLDFSRIKGKKKREYFSAVQAGLDKDYKPMEEIFSLVIEKTLKNYRR